MSDFYKLRNKVRHYDWGSAVDIPGLMGVESNGEPWAELWLGSNSGFSSLVSTDSCEISLEALIAGDKRRFLGEETARRYGALPFLLKLLAAEKPLSIQAHPNLAQAREGFERENKAGLALDSPKRNYKDSNHKPEIIAALTPFTGLCGFRSVDEIFGLFNIFLEPAPPVLREGFAPLLGALSNNEPAAALRDFLAGLFSLSQTVREALTGYILSFQEPPLSALPLSAPPRGCEFELMRNLARLYPCDPAMIAPIYLNVFRLEPGEAVFLEAGILHSYIRGFGVELMANSDNVLRGGLTGKHIDVPELMKILAFKPYKPCVITPDTSYFSYPALCEEFRLARICGSGAVETWPPAAGSTAALGSQASYDGPSICIVTEGELVISSRESETIVKRGESLFIPPVKSDDVLSLNGNFTLFVASVGLQV
jgi:mannose-6-phosphate isomerase